MFSCISPLKADEIKQIPFIRFLLLLSIQERYTLIPSETKEESDALINCNFHQVCDTDSKTDYLFFYCNITLIFAPT